MTTPLQQAAQAILARWDAPASTQQILTGEHIYEQLRKALDAELAQTETGTRNLRVPEIAQSVEPCAVFQGRVDSGEHGAFNLDLLKMIPRGAYLYLRPPQPQATTPVVPEGYVLVPVEPTPAMCAEGLEDEGLTIKDGFKYAYALYTCMVKTAQGEKP